MGIRAKQLLAGTLGGTGADLTFARAAFGANLFDSTTAGTTFTAQSIAGSKIVNGDITGTQLATSVAGNGLTGGGGSALSVQPNTTDGGAVPGVEVAANGLRLAAAAAGAGLTGGAGAALAVGAGTGVTVNANDVALELATGTPTYSGSHVSTHTVDTLQVTGTPGTSNDAVNKAYVDSLVNGQLWKAAADLGTAAALPAVTYDNGTAGVGATLTADAVGVLTIDGVATVLNDRVLIQDQVAGLQNGIYDVTTEGTAGVAFILTRTTDADNSPGNELEAAAIFIIAGTANGGLTYVQTATSVTIGTTALVWTQSSGASAASAGAGLTASGNVFNVGAGNGISVAADAVSVDVDSETGGNIQPANLTANGVGVDINAIAGTGLEADGSANLRLASQGAGIAGGGGSTLSFDATAADGNGLTGTGSSLAVTPDTVATDNSEALVVGANGVQINGDVIDIDYAQSNYTPATTGTGVDVNDLAAHLEGIDNALGAAGGTQRQEAVTTEAITGSDTAISDTLNNTPLPTPAGGLAPSLKLFLNGILQVQGAGNDYTVAGSTITWLASSGSAVDMDTTDVLIAAYVS